MASCLRGSAVVWFSETEKVRLESSDKGGAGGKRRGSVTLRELPNSLATPTVMLAPPSLRMSGTVSMVTTPVTLPRLSTEMWDRSEAGDVERW